MLIKRAYGRCLSAGLTAWLIVTSGGFAGLTVTSPADSDSIVAPCLVLGISGESDAEGEVAYNAGIRLHGGSASYGSSAGMTTGQWGVELEWPSPGLAPQMYDAYVKDSSGAVVDFNPFYVVEMPM